MLGETREAGLISLISGENINNTVMNFSKNISLTDISLYGIIYTVYII